MKKIEEKLGNKTIIKFLPDDYKEDGCDDKYYGDMTTTARNRIDFYDIPQDKWDKVFGNKNK